MTATNFETHETHEASFGQHERFYDRLRNRIHSFVQRQGNAIERVADYLLLVPDIFILLVRLSRDARVSGKNKVLLGSGIAYFVFPFDVVPEAILGPMGYLDDLVFGVYILNKMLTDTPIEILREHWSGHEDLLDTIRRVLIAADTLFAEGVLDRLKK